jgi:hypothetical protein
MGTCWCSASLSTHWAKRSTLSTCQPMIHMAYGICLPYDDVWAIPGQVRASCSLSFEVPSLRIARHIHASLEAV